ncbi:DUF6415 family natural product biosynthesis protein [Streptomyces sp. NPDC001118]
MLPFGNQSLTRTLTGAQLWAVLEHGASKAPGTFGGFLQLTAMLRGHLELLIPGVEAKARRLPKESVPRYCALACVGEATRKLRLGDGCTPPVRVAVARKLARCVKALCDHYENLRAEQP